MSKVLTFSRFFPKLHPKEGKPTYFVEKIYASIGLVSDNYAKHFQNDSPDFIETEEKSIFPKHHTIRAGNNWKAGDWFSPRVWSGKPYASKQIQFTPELQVKKVFNFQLFYPKKSTITCMARGLYHRIDGFARKSKHLSEVAKNDGLHIDEFIYWFARPGIMKNDFFEGQIICWNEHIDY